MSRSDVASTQTLHKADSDHELPQADQLPQEFDRASTASPNDTASRASSTSSSSVTPREGSDEEPSHQGSIENAPDDTSRACKHTFCTDSEISGAARLGGERELVRWQAEQTDTFGVLEEVSNATRRGHWDQFKVNQDLFGYVSTFKDDLSQYTTRIDKSKVPLHMQRKAQRIARDIETNQAHKGDEDDLERQEDDEEKLFSSVPRFDSSSATAVSGVAASRSVGTSDAWQQDVVGSQKPVSGKQRRLEDLHRLQQESKVAGAYFHVDGVGLMDERVVRSHPWLLRQGGAPVAQAYPGQCPQTMFSTTSTPPPAPPPPPCMVASPCMAAAMPAPLTAEHLLHVIPTPARTYHSDPVEIPALLAPGTQIVIAGLTKNPTFNGLHGFVDVYDAVNDRYDVLLALQHGSCHQKAKLKAENLKLFAPMILQ